MANVGLLQGMSAIIPTDDFWRKKDFVMREQQMGIARKQAEQQRQEALQKAIQINPIKVHGSMQDAYEEGLRPLVTNMFDIAKRSNGAWTKELSDAKMAVDLYQRNNESVSQGFDLFGNIPDKNLDPNGLWLKKQINARVPYKKIEQNYISTFGQSAPPLKLNENGVPDATPFFIPDPDYLKPIETEADKNQIFEIGKEVNVAGKKGQLKTLYSPKTPKEAQDFAKKYGQEGIMSVQEIAFNRLGDETVYTSAFVANRDELKSRYDEAISQLDPNAQQMVNETPELKKQLSKTILSEIIAEKIGKKPKYDIEFGYQPKGNTNIRIGGRNTSVKEEGDYTNIGTNFKEGKPQAAFQTTYKGTEGMNPKYRANQALLAYGNALGVATEENFTDHDPNNGIVYIREITPELTASFAKTPISTGSITLKNGQSLNDWANKNLSSDEKKSFDKLFGANIFGGIESEKIELRTKDGKQLISFADVEKDPKIINSAVPYLTQRFKIDTKIYNSDNRFSQNTPDEVSLLQKIAALNLYRSTNIKTTNLAGYDKAYKPSAKQYVEYGSQSNYNSGVNNGSLNADEY